MKIAKFQTIPTNLAWCKGCENGLHKAHWALKVKTGNFESWIGVCSEYVKQNKIKTRNNINIYSLHGER